MKIKLDAAREAFDVVDHVAASPVLESSQFVRIKQSGPELTLALTGTLWAEASALGEGEGKWTAWADRRALKAFLATARGDDLEVFYKDKLVLRAGQRLESQPHASIGGYERWEPQKVFDLTDDQRSAVRTAVNYLPDMAGSEHVEAAWFSQGYGVIATDTLFMMAVTGSDVKTDFFLPAAVAQVLAGSDGKLAADGQGVGVILPLGRVYQPLDSKLDGFPKDNCKAMVANAKKSQALASMKAAELRDCLATASQFLLDKQEVAKVEASKTGVLFTVDMSGGKFERVVKTQAACGIKTPVLWPVKKIMPWLDHAVGVGSSALEVEFAHMQMTKDAGAGVLRFSENKRSHVFIFVDVS